MNGGAVAVSDLARGLAQAYPDGLFLGERFHDGEAHFPAVAAHLVSAVGGGRVDVPPGVDPDVACPQPARDAVGAADVPGEDRCSKAVGGGVREFDGLVLGTE